MTHGNLQRVTIWKGDIHERIHKIIFRAAFALSYFRSYLPCAAQYPTRS